MYRTSNSLVSTAPDTKPDLASASALRSLGAATFIGTFGTGVLIQGCMVLQGILTARLLGPVGRGEYATVILWPNVFSAIGIFGTNIALARAAAKTDCYAQITQTAILLALLTSAVASIACYFSLPYLLPKANAYLLGISRVFVAFIVIAHLTLNLLAVDQGAGNFKRFNFTRALLYPIYICFLLGMWLLANHSVRWVVMGLLYAHLVVVVMRLIVSLKDMRQWGRLYSPVAAMRESVQFGLVGAAMPLYQQADKATVLWLLGAGDLGLYVVALSASAVCGTITNSAGLVSFTAAAQARPGEGFEALAKTVRISALLWLIIGGFFVFAMPLALPLVYGAEFALAVNPARLLIVGSAFGGLANLLDQTLRGQGRAFIGFEARIIGMVGMVISGALLSAHLGLGGMCLAYGLAQLICLFFFLLRVLDHYGQSRRGIRSFRVRREDIEQLLCHLRAVVMMRLSP